MSAKRTDRRQCRACGESYDYPTHKSLATRSHCERCVRIPPESRKALESLRRRVDRLAREVESLKGGQNQDG